VTASSPFKTPAQLFSELGITAPSQIDIEAIAQHCGATIVYEPLVGSEAYILGHHDRAIITVNSAAASRGRQRFSAAHELGHWMRDRGTTSFACEKRKMFLERRQEDPERLANVYAVDLLLPESMFLPRVKNKDITFDTVRALASEFETSLTATAIRVVKFGSFPSILVCSEDGRKKWAIFGPDIFLRLRDEPGPNSIAYGLLHGSENADRPSDIYADEWVEHRHADRYSVREHSIRSGFGVLTLLWWKDERLLLERG
jgi:Zn-dependent peptidase ImmA (M78 family)